MLVKNNCKTNQKMLQSVKNIKIQLFDHLINFVTLKIMYRLFRQIVGNP